jgi:hypothetical protein
MNDLFLGEKHCIKIIFFYYNYSFLMERKMVCVTKEFLNVLLVTSIKRKKEFIVMFLLFILMTNNSTRC